VRWPRTYHVSPKNYRSKARALALRSDVPSPPSAKKGSLWFSHPRRPYCRADDRQKIVLGTKRLVRLGQQHSREPSVYHVDFTGEEVQSLCGHVRTVLGLPPDTKRTAIHFLKRILKKNLNLLSTLPNELEDALAGRESRDIYNFLWDMIKRSVRPTPQVLSLEIDSLDKHNEAIRASHVPSLLFAREVEGNRGFGRGRGVPNFTNEFLRAREDGLELQAEWTNCAGDISTIAWVGKGNFICGTTTHSDSHNQQYNKPGNLLLGSSSLGTLKAYPDHRIVRPIVEQGDNSTDEMRESQDPWLYSSVVSSDYDPLHDRAYTSSFDKTVKVWMVERSGKSMSLIGTWEHSGNVNFVVVSKHASGMVATAADVPSKAVRVYHMNGEDVFYDSFSCWREDVPLENMKWGYFPATIQWGLADSVKHLLLVGFSPRSISGDDNDIPEDKRDSGEVCLWNTLTGEKIRVGTASTQNVFEVAWHPTQPSFIVATSPCGHNIEDHVRTQIRIFRPADHSEQLGGYSEFKCLDCPAADINELTIRPNSFTYCYITAASTDGNIYVWDTAHSDKPLRILRHGEPVEEYSGEREREDTGVKFTAWGTSLDRFYSGSSDGVVKVWNVRSTKPLVRDLLQVSGPVSFGTFSPDFSRLLIGDASGRVYLLSVDKEDQLPTQIVNLPVGGGARSVRRPKLITAHPDPPPPPRDGLQRSLQEPSGVDRARHFLVSGQLRAVPDPTIGVVQGPNYADMALYRRDAHLDSEPSAPLLGDIEGRQQENVKMFARRERIPKLRLVSAPTSRTLAQHEANLAQDLEFSSLDRETQLEFLMEGVDFSDADYEDEDFGLSYEEMPSTAKLREWEDKSEWESSDFESSEGVRDGARQ
jgi:WD40 repeat protein